MLTTVLDLLPRLRISGVVPLLALYPFMAWTGTALPFYRIYSQVRTDFVMCD
jgi:hypothetical protein